MQGVINFFAVYLRYLRMVPLTFGSLPPTPKDATFAFITDCNISTRGGTAAAGGSNKVLIRFDAASGNWIIM